MKLLLFSALAHRCAELSFLEARREEELSDERSQMEEKLAELEVALEAEKEEHRRARGEVAQVRSLLMLIFFGLKASFQSGIMSFARLKVLLCFFFKFWTSILRSVGELFFP